MAWNYRALRKEHPTPSGKPEVLYQVHEVHYDKGGRVNGWTEEPAKVVADTADELLDVLAMMVEGLGHPVLCAQTGAQVGDALVLSDNLRSALRASADHFERDDGKFERVATVKGSQPAGEPREAPATEPKSEPS